MTEIRGMVRNLIMETYMDFLEPAYSAESGSADRIELCADLIIGGTTLNSGLMYTVRHCVKADFYSMIRPRYGDFCYYDSECVHIVSWATKEREWRRRT